MLTIIVLSGVLARSRMRREVWNTARAIKFKWFHKVMAYTMLAVSQYQLQRGAYDYGTNVKHLTKAVTVSVTINQIVLIVLFLYFEIRY